MTRSEAEELALGELWDLVSAAITRQHSFTKFLERSYDPFRSDLLDMLQDEGVIE